MPTITLTVEADSVPELYARMEEIMVGMVYEDGDPNAVRGRPQRWPPSRTS